MISYDTLLPLAEHYQEDLTNFRLTGDITHLIEFIKAAAGADQRVLKDEFFNALTLNEKQAFYSIVQEIGLSGNISVVKMIQKTTLSRPVWTSLLQKMEKYGVAEVKSQGVKGTHIEIKEGIVDGNNNT